MMNILKRLIANTSRVDVTLALLLTLSVFALYVQTLVPSVLDGDPGQFQYITAVLGIPYPPGFPLYLLLGYIWSFLPIGTLAYRMNLLSAFFGALTVGALFVALRQQKVYLLAALGGALTLAFVPTFWQYSTLAAEYTLHTFITVLLLIFLDRWETSQQTIWLWMAMLSFGLGLTNHPTFLLFAPAAAMFVVLVGGRSLVRHPQFFLRSLALGALPCSLYLYFPLRGHQLLVDNFVLPDWPIAVAQGIVSPFFKENPEGLVQYLTASTFVKTIARSWKWDTLVVDWGKTVLQSLSMPIIAGSLLGIARLVKQRVKLAIWLGVGLVTFALIALQYVYATIADITDFAPYFTKFFLPGFVILTILAAWAIDALLRGIAAFLSRFKLPPVIASTIALVLVSILLIASWQDLITRHSNFWIERSAELEAKWDTIRKYPPENGAALVGHWGDLTPLWYLQNAEAWRQDLVTLYPPVDEQIDAWLAEGKPLYLTGPLLGWAPGIVKNKYLIPWGPLIRVTDRKLNPSSPLSHAAFLTFRDNRPIVRMLGYDLSRETSKAGDTLDIAVYWEILDNIPLDNYLVYFSLSVPNAETKSQGDVLVVNWHPTGRLLADQRALGTYRYRVPKETVLGTYVLNLFVYSIDSAKNLDIIETREKETIAELGTINVQRAR